MKRALLLPCIVFGLCSMAAGPLDGPGPPPRLDFVSYLCIESPKDRLTLQFERPVLRGARGPLRDQVTRTIQAEWFRALSLPPDQGAKRIGLLDKAQAQFALDRISNDIWTRACVVACGPHGYGCIVGCADSCNGGGCLKVRVSN